MVGKYNRDTSSVTATPSTVTSSSAAFGRWAFGIGQPPRDRRGRTGIVKGRSVRSGGNVLTTLSCSASGIFAICCDLTRATITRLAHTFQSTRTRRCREQYIPLVALCLRHSWADFIICMCVFDFRQAQVSCWALLDWLETNGIAESKHLEAVSRVWKKKPSVANSVYEFAINLREIIYELLVARIRGKAALKVTLVALNNVLS